MTMTHPVKKTVAATAIAASTLGGIGAGAMLFAPGNALAQDGTDDSGEADEARPDRGKHLAEALQPLVDDGTLSSDQVDAVIDTLEAARPEQGHRGHGPLGFGGFGGGDLIEVLGVEASELREALANGETIADVAAANGVPVQDVIDAIVDAAEDRVNAALESDRIDQEKADEILAGAAERAEDIVNGEIEFRGRDGRGHGPGPAGDEAPADA